jgi:uncharacterized protein YceK
MKTRVMIMGTILIPLLLSGCGKPTQGTGPGANLYPPEVAGIWKAQGPDQEWAIKVERDGSISKVFHPLVGPIRVAEGGANLEGPDKGTFALFVLGTCRSEYQPSGRILKAIVNLDSYHFKLPQGELQGRSETSFEGPVSSDGSTWTAKVRDYTVLEGADKPDRKAIDDNPETVVFQKVDASSFKVLDKPAPEDTK